MATLTKNNPYDISSSGDVFFADSRNVEAVQRDIDAAHRLGAKFTGLVKNISNLKDKCFLI